MGRDVQIETENGVVVRRLLDERDRVNWILSFERSQSSVCLRFIDSYGDTVFNHLQLEILKGEFAQLAARMTDEALDMAKRDYVSRHAWPPGVIEEVKSQLETVSADELHSQLRRVLELGYESFTSIDRGWFAAVNCAEDRVCIWQPAS